MICRSLFLFIFCIIANHSFGQTQVPEVKVDTTITGFRFAADFQGTKVYTRNGPADITGTVNPSAFSVTVFKDSSLDQAVKNIETLLKMAAKTGYQHSALYRQDTVINNNQTIIISVTESYAPENFKNLLFNGCFIKGNTVVLFTSGDTDGGKYTELFRKTFYALKLD
ncbi:MAG: hypothetical protein J7527_16100 [Chitinophagaceae bacterium]|nr:hypothetical protein [Chitinophagaceae bacterium]